MSMMNTTATAPLALGIHTLRFRSFVEGVNVKGVGFTKFSALLDGKSILNLVINDDHDYTNSKGETKHSQSATVFLKSMMAQMKQTADMPFIELFELMKQNDVKGLYKQNRNELTGDLFNPEWDFSTFAIDKFLAAQTQTPASTTTPPSTDEEDQPLPEL